VDRRAFLSTVAGGLLAAPLAAEGQQRKRVPRVGFLLPGSPSDSKLFQNPDAFPNKLRELGWVDGGNVILEFRWAPDPDGYPTAAAELVRLGVNVLVTVGFEATSAAMKTTSTIPIVMTAFSDPRDVGAASLAHPGGNVTGMTTGQVEAELAKRLGLLKEALPAIRRVAILWDAKVIGGTTDLLAAASSLKVQLQNLDVTSVADYDAAFRTAQQGGAGAVLAVEGARMLVNRILVAQLGLKHRLPLMSQYRQLVEANALMSYGADLKDSGAHTASYVDRILKGAKPADLPIEQPTKYELVINLKTAKALGLTIPPSLLQRADQVIE
jgi:putative tryptophan/tyrosine transport system substrate-binding protein